MELEILCRMSMMLGFLTAGFAALLLAALAAVIWLCVRATTRELDHMLEELEREEDRDADRL